MVGLISAPRLQSLQLRGGYMFIFIIIATALISAVASYIIFSALAYYRQKPEAEIRAKARAEGFAKAEAIMQEALDKTRAAARDREAALVKEHEADMTRAMKECDKSLGRKSSELMDHIELLKEQIRRDRKAWNQYRDYLPEALRVVHLLRADAYNRVEEAGARFNHLGNYENSLDSLVRTIDKIAPKIQELLEGDMKVQQIMGNGDLSQDDKK